MNRATTTLGIALLIAAAPAAHAAGFHAGIKGGMNIANQSSDVSASELADSRKAMSVGGWLQLPVTPMLSVQPEAYFAMKGDGAESGGVTSTLVTDYLEVPVLAKIGFGAPAMPVKPSLYAGPSVGINLSAKAKVEGSGASDGETDVKDQVKATDFGVLFGGGLEFGNVGLDVRYTKGLTNINDSGSGEEVKNNVFSILGSFRFF